MLATCPETVEALTGAVCIDFNAIQLKDDP
jgi:hypothetical protein